MLQQPHKVDPSQVLSAIKSAFTLSSFVVIISYYSLFSSSEEWWEYCNVGALCTDFLFDKNVNKILGGGLSEWPCIYILLCLP